MVKFQANYFAISKQTGEKYSGIDLFYFHEVYLKLIIFFFVKNCGWSE